MIVPPTPKRAADPPSPPPRTIDDLFDALEQALGSPALTLAQLLGRIERLKATAWERLLREIAEDLAGRSDRDSLDEVRHLTPLQVAELLSLKEPCVHELCRSGRLPAIKQGKYWMISVAGLRRWVTSPNSDIDSASTRRLESPNPRGDTAPGPVPGRHVPRRRSPTVG